MVAIDLRRAQCRGVEIAVAIDRLQHHWVVRGDAVEFVHGEAARVVVELFFRPAAEHRDPRTRLRRTHALAEQFERPCPRRHAIEPQFVVFGGAHPVGMVVDQAGDDGAPAEIDHLCCRTFERVDFGRIADFDDTRAANRECLRDGEAVVHRDDLAVEKNEIGRLRPGGDRSNCQCNSNRGDVEQPHSGSPGVAPSDVRCGFQAMVHDHRRLIMFSETISPLKVKSCGSEGSTVTRTQCVSGQPKVSTRVKFSNSRLVFLL